MITPRFTIDGDPSLERHLDQVCNRVTDEVRACIPGRSLEGLLLGGGYGRGEGGVLKTASGDRPYNDLEFYVFVRGNAFLAQRRWHAALHAIGERLSPEAGLEVEFKVLTRSKLRRSEPSMFYYDLVLGHRCLLGDETLLAQCEQHRDAGRIPLHEATRLLMNRCSGLLFSAARLAQQEFAEEDADFVGRNVAKAQLAFGDAVLVTQGHYDWSCRRRGDRLAKVDMRPEPSWLSAVQRHHVEGVRFKLHPVRSTASREVLAGQHGELVNLGRMVWLWLEAKRLGQDFASSAEYASSPTDKCPETGPLKNLLLQTHQFGLAGVRDKRRRFRYPRERLMHALCWLLWEREALSRADTRARLRQELLVARDDDPALIEAYGRLWNRFN